MSWRLRWRRGSPGPRHLVTLVHQEAVNTLPLWLGDEITISDTVSMFAQVELLGDRHVRITIHSDDERLTSSDLDLLRERPPVPA